MNSLHFLQFRQQQPIYAALGESLANSIESTIDGQAIFLTIQLLGLKADEGSTLVELIEFAGKQYPLQWEITGQFPDLANWCTLIDTVIKKAKHPFLVRIDNALMLARQAEKEQSIAQRLIEKAQHMLSSPDSQSIPPSEGSVIDWQQVAIANSLCSHLSIIVGGPGTGKTTTVVKILQALLLQQPGDYKVGLTAPTGKAAIRLLSSIKSQLNALSLDAAVLPKEAKTLHRLMAWSQQHRQFQYNEKNQLPFDCLIVDEVSMIDMALFHDLLKAVPKHCQLILLGDPYQLPSVQAGNILADLAQPEWQTRFSQQRYTLLAPFLKNTFIKGISNPIADSIVSLKTSYRFDPGKGIGALADAILTVNETKLFDSFESEEVSWLTSADFEQLKTRLKAHFRALSTINDIDELFKKLNEFQLLCSHKEGDWGTKGLNRWLVDLLKASGRLQYPLGEWVIFHGMPVILEQNRYDLSLYNGDIGIVVEIEASLRIAFLSPEGNIRLFLPQQLMGIQPAFAITVHKSQGCEFDQVALVLPNQATHLVTRNLFYTAVTRAKNHFCVVADQLILNAAISNQPTRQSAVGEWLAKEPNSILGK